MITIKDFMECVSYRITDGDEYCWGCYGPNARSMDFWNEEHGDDSKTVCMVYDTKTQVVYQMEAWDESNSTVYRWIHPDYRDSHKAETERRGAGVSFDDFKIIDIDVEEDILEKATAIANNEEYDKRVMVTLSLTHDEEHQLMELAHEADMSLNLFVEKILREEIKKHGVEI